jgi:hypothetical protein
MESMIGPLHYRRERINPVCGAVAIQGQRLRLTHNPKDATCADCQRWLERLIRRPRGPVKRGG